MFGILKKLFGGDSAKPEISSSMPASAPFPQTIAKAVPFLRREPVFDRNNRLSGHLFYVQESTALADAERTRQRDFDQTLLETLNASPQAWNTNLAFIPISSSSLDLTEIEYLKTTNVVLLIQLATDAEAEIICDAITQLHERGIQVGVFRQPKNPAFAKVITLADHAAVDVSGNEANAPRDFSAAVRAVEKSQQIRLLACNIDTEDEHRCCRQWYYENFHGKFATAPPANKSDPAADPHRAQLIDLLRLVQGDAETAEIASAMKQDPLLSFRILRYLNSPALGLTHRIDSLEQALIILGRQRLTRWLAVLLFSVRDPHVDDWLMVENALTRGRLMEVLGEVSMPGQSHDPLFLTGIFSCLSNLLRRPLAEILDDMLLADDIRHALLEHRGPYAKLLAVAEASEDFDLPRMEKTALAAGIDSECLNRALLAATAWASEVTEYWE